MIVKNLVTQQSAARRHMKHLSHDGISERSSYMFEEVDDGVGGHLIHRRLLHFLVSFVQNRYEHVEHDEEDEEDVENKEYRSERRVGSLHLVEVKLAQNDVKQCQTETIYCAVTVGEVVVQNLRMWNIK